MCLRQFGNRVLPFFKRSGGCVLRCRDVGGKHHSTNDTDALARKRESLFLIYVMPAGSRHDGNARLDDSAIEVTDEVLSNAARGYLKAAIGKGGAKRGSVTMEIVICDGMLMNDTIIIPPLQEACPTVTLRIANAAGNLEWRREPQDFRALLFARSRDNLHRQTFLRIHREGITSFGFCFTFHPLKNLARIDKAIGHLRSSPQKGFPLLPSSMRS